RVRDEFLGLNPPGASGTATYRMVPDAADPLAAIYPPSSLVDQINCVLRDVGTFPPQDMAPNTAGITATGAPKGVLEVSQNMKDLAIGATGFNIPSLLGLGVGAPYFHAGNARTLEEVFDDAFERHYQSFLATKPVPEQVRALVAYVLTIDDDLKPIVTPNAAVNDLCS